MIGRLKYAHSEGTDVFDKFGGVEELYFEKYGDDREGGAEMDQFLDEVANAQDEIKRIMKDLEGAEKFFNAKFGNLGV